MTWIVRDGIAVACIPKSGSISMRQCLRHFENMTHDDVMHIDKRLAWVREPFNRLVSNYGFWFALNEMKTNGRERPTIEETSSWVNFVDFVIDNQGDPHWSPQYDFLSNKGKYVPTDTFPFEKLHSNWNDYFRGALPWLNAYEKLPVTESYRRDEIDEIYKMDIELCRSL